MIEDRLPRDLLSDAEVHALLEEEALSAGGPPPAVLTQEVLLVCRRGRDAEWLQARLAAHGARTRWVRSPLAALETICAAPPGAVITDLELWARGGNALLERIRQIGAEVRVLFLRAGAERGFRQTTGEPDGPWGYLAKPLEPAALEAAVGSLLANAGRTSPDRAPASAALPAAGVRGGPVVPAEPPGPVAPVAESPARLAEVPWLRFCLALSRELRSPDGFEVRAGRVLAAARELLGASDVGLVAEREGLLDLRCQCAPGRVEPLSAALCAAVPGAGKLVLGESGTSGRRLVCLGVPREIEAAAPRFAADVDDLLAMALRG